MNHERRQLSDGEHGPEGESQAEVARFLSQLDAEAGRVGSQLEETDFVRIGPDDAMRLYGKIELIMRFRAGDRGKVLRLRQPPDGCATGSPL